MLRLAADADVRGPLIRGLSRIPELDLVRSIDHLPEGTPDPQVVDWAAEEGRVLITFDRSTMMAAVYGRLDRGLNLPGVIIANSNQSIHSAINDIHVIAACMSEEEMAERVIIYLPFRV